MRGSVWLQDGDPRQNSKVAKAAWKTLGCEMFAIPARSPVLNPIENLFHMVRRQLKEDAPQEEIKQETYSEFCTRVKETIQSYSSDYIDRTIASMPDRVQRVVKRKGGRTKF